MASSLTTRALLALACSAPAAGQCEVQHLKGLEIHPGVSGFGHEFSFHADTLFVGSYQEPNPNGKASGAVYVFERTPTGWQRRQRIQPKKPLVNGLFGTPSVWGDQAAVTTWGKGLKQCAVRFYERKTNKWKKQQFFQPADLAADDEFGYSVEMQGDVCVVGSPKDDYCPGGDPNCNSGSIYVLGKGPDGWVERAKLVQSDPLENAALGVGLAIDGYRIVAGAPGRASAYVFERSNSGWVQTARLQASDHSPSSYFGWNCDVSGDRIVVAAERADQRGAVYVFELGPGEWVQTAKLLGSKIEPNDLLGWSGRLEGAVAMAGAPVIPGTHGSGSLVVFDVPVGTSGYCFGESCPCGTEDPTRGCRNVTGRGASLAACGSTSVAADELELRASSLPAGAPAVFLMGAATGTVPVGNGHLCVASGPAKVFRYEFRQASKVGSVQEGPGLVATADTRFEPAGHIASGDTWHFQVAYRDAAQCGAGVNTTNATAVTFVP